MPVPVSSGSKSSPNRSAIVVLMNSKIQKNIFIGIALLIVILLFTIVDHAMHGLSENWSVPDYYFKDKIPFGFLWGIVGIRLANKVESIWLRSFALAITVAATLQVRYFIEGYDLNFVLLFLLFHFLILYVLSFGMFSLFKKFNYL